MFKKKLAALVAAALLSLSASSAFAAFANFDLIRVISDKTSGSTLELATNLGNITTLAGLAPGSVVGGGTNAFSLFTGASLSNLSVTYFAVNRTSLLNGTMYISAATGTAPITGGFAQIQNQLATTGGAANNPVLAYYNSISTTAQTVVGNNTAPGSLAGHFGTTNLGTYGSYAGLAWAGVTNVNMASLTASAPLTTTIWQFGPGNMGATFTGVKVLDISLNADGSSTINPTSGTPTPIPAAAWLLGSGLMGLVGLRRRKNA